MAAERACGSRVGANRLECNTLADLPRFERLLRYAKAVHADSALRAFALVNALEPPLISLERIQRMMDLGVAVDVVSHTPHDWEDRRPYVNRGAGWTAGSLAAAAALSHPA